MSSVNVLVLSVDFSVRIQVTVWILQCNSSHSYPYAGELLHITSVCLINGISMCVYHFVTNVHSAVFNHILLILNVLSDSDKTGKKVLPHPAEI